MSKVLTVDEAISILQYAKITVGGDAALVLSLTSTGVADVDVNDMVVMLDEDSRYVEVQAFHPQLAETDSWLIYRDEPRMLFDAVEDEGFLGPMGSCWQPATYKAAKQFIDAMCHCEGWNRGHWFAPRY